MSKERKSLGRGLGSIIAAGVVKKSAEAPAPKGVKTIEIKAAPSAEGAEIKLSTSPSLHGLFSEISIEKIALSPYQARKDFHDEDIAALADSIASEGLMQPILVRQLKDLSYELIAGERRLRACRKLGLKRIVACVQVASDVSAAVKGLIENLQRADLNPMEEAQGVANLMANFHLTQESAAQRLGKPRSSVANALRLLTLPEEVRGYIAKGLISQGHAKVLLSVEDRAQQTVLARKIIENGLNVRNTEEAVKRLKNESLRKTDGTRPAAAAQSAVIKDLQNKISHRLNASVTLKHAPKRGKIVIEYLGNDDLQRILEIIGINT